MKVSEMIAGLQEIKAKYGDINVIMASDSEGNSYSTIDKNFKYSRVYEREDQFAKAYESGIISAKPTEAVDQFFKNSKVIGICLYPFQEDYESAESAVNGRNQ